MTSPLHPDCVALLEMIREMGRPRFEALPYPETRVLYAAGPKVLQPPPPEVADDRRLALPNGVALRFYRPLGSTAAEKLPCLIFVHGGGWVVGDIETHNHLARSLANLAGCAVLSVDYRLAPEHPFPAAVDDCADAVRYAVSEAEALGVDPARLAVGGDSAGGNIAAVLALMARDGALPPLRHQMLLYPVTDMAQTHESYVRFTDGLPLVDATMRWFRGHYAPHRENWDDWRASPLRAASVAGTAPAFVLTVGYDPLCDEGRDYASRLDREGVRVTHFHAADLLHGVLTMSKVVRPAEALIAAAAASLRDAIQ
ncbi:alpha/beta hydrolase [Roseococcus sp. YIM B11640]|uniref:alpha/beta hydrolase n=1 Tax=Roseococcus sp. YIM B11640 TaxID=3133973 RepID=UPI003C7BB152